MNMIGEKIKLLRVQKGLNLKELGEKVSLSDTALSKIENGKTISPGIEVSFKIAEALGTNIYELFGYESFTTKPEDQNKLEKEIEELKIKLSEKEQLIKALQNEKVLFGKHFADELVSNYDNIVQLHKTLSNAYTNDSQRCFHKDQADSYIVLFWKMVDWFKSLGFITDEDIDKAIEKAPEKGRSSNIERRI